MAHSWAHTTVKREVQGRELSRSSLAETNGTWCDFARSTPPFGATTGGRQREEQQMGGHLSPGVSGRVHHYMGHGAIGGSQFGGEGAGVRLIPRGDGLELGNTQGRVVPGVGQGFVAPAMSLWLGKGVEGESEMEKKPRVDLLPRDRKMRAAPVSTRPQTGNTVPQSASTSLPVDLLAAEITPAENHDEFLERMRQQLSQMDGATCEATFPKDFDSIMPVKSLAKVDSPSSKLFACPSCPKTFPNRSRLKKHAVCHSGVKPYQCSQCPSAFARKDHLKEHQSVHSDQKPHKCSLCPATFARSSSLRFHERLHSGLKPYRCQQCPQAFAHPSSMKKHLLMHSRAKPFKCLECPADFPTALQLNEHIREHAGEKPFRCPQCPAIYTSAGSLKAHSRLHSGETPYTCPECSTSFPKVEHLRRHLHKVHPDTQPQQSSLTCPKCQQQCESKSALRQHMATSHAKERPYQCPHCPLAFTRSDNLKRHRAFHSGHKPFRCGECGAAFAMKHYLKHHMISHTQDKALTCPHCPATFLYQYNLNRHVASLHSGDLPFRCPDCPAAFPREFHLKRHRKLHRADVWRCPQCPAVFTMKHHLRDHARKHSGERPFRCPECPMSFARRFCLKQHILTHRGQDESFQCPRCPATFKLHRTLDKHLQAHEKSDFVSQQVHDTRPALGQFSCGVCQAEFSEAEELSKHLLVEHADDAVPSQSGSPEPFTGQTDGCEQVLTAADRKLYVCLQCPEAFAQPSALKAHIERDHGQKAVAVSDIPACLLALPGSERECEGSAENDSVHMVLDNPDSDSDLDTDRQSAPPTDSSSPQSVDPAGPTTQFSAAHCGADRASVSVTSEGDCGLRPLVNSHLRPRGTGERRMDSPPNLDADWNSTSSHQECAPRMQIIGDDTFIVS